MENKSLLIEKIAKSAKLNCNSAENKKDTALKIASEMLKVAAEKHRKMEIEIAKLSLENNKFKNEKLASEKEQLVDTLVDTMFEIGMIKKADIEAKKEEFMVMDKTAIELFKNTVDSIPPKTAGYVSDLNFLFDDNNIIEKENLSTAIGNYIK